MRRTYAKLEDFTVIATHEDEKLKGERLSQRASEDIEYGRQLITCKGLLK